MVEQESEYFNPVGDSQKTVGSPFLRLDRRDHRPPLGYLLLVVCRSTLQQITNNKQQIALGDF
jgi:hypothetical protein